MTDRPTLTWPGTGEAFVWDDDYEGWVLPGTDIRARETPLGRGMAWCVHDPGRSGETPQEAINTMHAAMSERHTALGKVLGVRRAPIEGERAAMRRAADKTCETRGCPESDTGCPSCIDATVIDGYLDETQETAGAVRIAEAPQSAMHARHKIDEAIHRLYEERAKVLDADDARGDVSEYTTSLAEVIDYFEAAEAHMKYSSEDLVAHGNACRAVERSRIEQALRPNGACIWCKREDGHGEGCVVAAAVKGEVSGGSPRPCLQCGKIEDEHLMRPATGQARRWCYEHGFWSFEKKRLLRESADG